MKRKVHSKVHRLTRSLKGIGKSVGRGKPRSIAKQAMTNRKVKEAVLYHTGKLIRKDVQ